MTGSTQSAVDPTATEFYSGADYYDVLRELRDNAPVLDRAPADDVIDVVDDRVPSTLVAGIASLDVRLAQ